MPQGPLPAPLMRPLVVLALPGMYLFYKYNQYKRRQQESARRRLTERELQHLHHKIDKLLNKLEENEPELATTQEEECVICINAKATMQTAPCGHKVVCRKCFVKTIQMAVSQRLLPLRCVVCRAKILRLKQEPQSLTPDLSSPESSDPQVSSSSAPGGSGFAGKAGRSGVFPASVSAYSVTSTGTNVSSDGSMPNSDSLYSVSSGTSSISGASSLSGGGKHGIGARCCVGGHCFGGAYPRQPTGALRRSQTHSMKLRLQEYRHGELGPPGGRLPPIRELPPCPPPGPQAPSTRIRCAQKIVTQLETGPPPLIDKRDKKSALSKSTSKSTAKTNPKTTSKASMKSSTSASKISAVSSKTSASTTTKTSSTTAKSTTTASSSATQSKTSIIKNLTELTPSTSTKEVPYKPLQPSPSASGAFKKRLNDKLEKNDNKKNELAEKKREEKEKKRLEKEAKREAKREEEQAKREAKEEKKKAKKEAKLAAAAAKEKKN